MEKDILDIEKNIKEKSYNHFKKNPHDFRNLFEDRNINIEKFCYQDWEIDEFSYEIFWNKYTFIARSINHNYKIMMFYFPIIEKRILENKTFLEFINNNSNRIICIVKDKFININKRIVNEYGLLDKFDFIKLSDYLNYLNNCM